MGRSRDDSLSCRFDISCQIESITMRMSAGMANFICKENYASADGIEVFSPVRHTLFNPADIIQENGNWSRWLSDLFGIEENDSPEEEKNHDNNSGMDCRNSFEAFRLINALSDLMMLPNEMLAVVPREKKSSLCLVHC